MQTNLSQPSIEIFGTTIAEPMVTLTDLMITAVCVYTGPVVFYRDIATTFVSR